MKKNNLKFLGAIFLWLGVCLFVASCASKKPKGPQPPFSKQESGPVEKKQKQSVALVLGGAGVSSFATVGLLKGFEEEGIEIAYIVTTGWPSVFAISRGFMRSIHDVEWFAMRLKPNDFYATRLLGSSGFSDHSNISKKLVKTFKQNTLNQSSIPIVLTASNLRRQKPDAYDSGGWRSPLLKAVSIPPFLQGFPNRANSQWVFSQKGLDVDEALAREADIVIAVDMYSDYLRHLDKTPDSSEGLFRVLFATALRSKLDAQSKKAQLSARISLRKSPLDFSGKRQAIHQGYEQARKLSQSLKNLMSE